MTQNIQWTQRDLIQAYQILGENIQYAEMLAPNDPKNSLGAHVIGRKGLKAMQKVYDYFAQKLGNPPEVAQCSATITEKLLAYKNTIIQLSRESEKIQGPFEFEPVEFALFDLPQESEDEIMADILRPTCVLKELLNGIDDADAFTLKLSSLCDMKPMPFISGPEIILPIQKIAMNLNAILEKQDNSIESGLFELQGNCSSEQKKRAVQRALVEHLLELLLTGLEKDDHFMENFGVQLSHYFEKVCKELEEIELDWKDVPNDEQTHCVAHMLFGRLYQIYAEGCKTDSTLMDPNDSIFEGDFGRKAFCNALVSIQFRMQAFCRVVDALKMKWKF